MKLRSQLLLITVLVVLIPVAGWQFVKGLEQSLRQTHQQSLLDHASSIARTLAADHPDSLAGPVDGLYVHRLEGSIHLDGHDGEWDRWQNQARTLESTSDSLKAELLLAASPGGRLHLLLRVDDPFLIFGDPDHGPGDRVELRVKRDESVTRVMLAPLAPGWIEMQDDTGRLQVQGNWQPRTSGWNLELQIVEPARPDGIELTVLDVNDPATRTLASRAGTTGIEPLIHRDSALESQLGRLLADNLRAWITTEHGWVLAYNDSRPDDHPADGPAPILFERLLGDRLPPRAPVDEYSGRLSDPDFGHEHQARWMSSSDGSAVVVMAAAPIHSQANALGHVVLERRADEFLVMANQAVLRLFGSSLLGLFLIAGLLIGFAALLSERIRRLRNRAEAAVMPDGRVLQPIAVPRTHDEIGDLGRSMAELIERQYHHQDYLRTLADKLSHELRTPLATIRSSLDNLAEVDDEDDRERYRRRAEDGCQRLGSILQSMSQAARVEEALDIETLETVDLGQLLTDYVNGCRQSFSERKFELDLQQARHTTLRCAPELIAQLLDKLIENAVDFSPPASAITLRLLNQGDDLLLQVDNPGPPVPKQIADTLFDSMVSQRASGHDGIHLGLGLYVVRIIARHHGGSIEAIPLPDGSRFELRLPIDSA